jgi:hypothetical protein
MREKSADSSGVWHCQDLAVFAALRVNQHQYCINGRTMTWTDFLTELAPEPDNALRVWLILNHRTAS